MRRRMSMSCSLKQRGSKLLPSELAISAIAKAKRLKDLNAFTVLREDEVLEEARMADERIKDGNKRSPIDGEVVGVKDNFCLRGVPTTCGSNMLRNFFPVYDATVVQKTRDAGGIILGKTNLDEFGMGSGCIDSIFGPVKNLWRSGINYKLKRVPALNRGDFVVNTSGGSEKSWYISGGSSGGSAVAVSAGICISSLGSDTGGSVRIPASWCGLVGLKPTYGTVSRHGLIPLVNSLDVPGILARDVDTAINFYNIISGQDNKDSTTYDQSRIPSVSIQNDPDLSELRVGIPQEYYCSDMSEEVIEAWGQVADLFEENGIKVVPVSMPHTAYSITCYQVLNPCEVASNMARYDGLEYGLRTSETKSTEALFADVRQNGFNYVVRGRILAGNYFLLKENYERFFIQALKVRRLISEDFLKVWSSVDVLLTPVTLTAAPSFRQFSNSDNRTQTSKHDYCTQPVNLAGLPAATLPVKLSNDSLPIGLQIIGPKFGEQKVLDVCKWLENRLEFSPPILDDF